MSKSVTKKGGANHRTLEYEFDSAPASGEVSIEVRCRENSIYIYSIAIIWDESTAPETIPVTISSVGYSTLYYSQKTLKVPTGVEAYTVGVDGSRILLSAVGPVIPADEAVVLKGTAGTTYNFVVTDEMAEKSTDNLLKGFDEATTVSDAGYKYYMLSTQNGKNLGFYYEVEGGASIRSKAHRAYLPISDQSPASAKSFLLIDESTVGIGHVENECGEDVYHTLSGQRVGRPQRGIYIRNGKKVMMK